MTWRNVRHASRRPRSLLPNWAQIPATVGSYVKLTDEDCTSMASVLDGDLKTKANQLATNGREPSEVHKIVVFEIHQVRVSIGSYFKCRVAYGPRRIIIAP